jgi:hypothetical protein
MVAANGKAIEIQSQLAYRFLVSCQVRTRDSHQFLASISGFAGIATRDE